MGNDPYKYFRTEAREIVDHLGKEVLELEKAPRAPERIARLFRLAHTLKGAARVVKQGEVAELAHAMEDALGPLRDEHAVIEREGIESLLRIIDDIDGRVRALSPAAAAPQESAQAEPQRTLRADVAEMDALLDGLAEMAVELSALRQRASTVKDVRHLADVVAEEMSATGVRATFARETRTVAGDLRAALASLDRDLSKALEQMERELRQARELAERLRLVPAELMFNALERAARDAASTLGKSVAFETRGGDVRIDADVLSAMQSALVHAVRNAVAHGVEPPSERRAAGKAADGRISLEVARRGGRVAFTCRDDGRGIDMGQVARAAKRAGKVPEAQAPSEGDLLRLLLSGGVSTSAAVTDVSGRGVGLDVVRETASRLGGEVFLRSDTGRGTVLEVVVPVSLSSVEALLVESRGTIAALPLDAIRGTLRLGQGDVTRTADGESVRWEGRLVPFAPLARSLDLEASHREARSWSAVVLEGAGVFAAIGVDRLVGTESVILRTLPKEVHARPVVSGASLDARGLPQLFLDAAALAANVRAAKVPTPVASPTQRLVLVVDDSLTTRMLEKSILESAGYEVDLATSGEEGLAKARRRRYALFLVDVEMPGMDGFAFVQRTREDAELRGVPAILVTSRAAPEDRQRGAAAGASGYIVKSEFDQNDLLKRIGKLVG